MKKNELAIILKNMYENADKGMQVAAIHIFGIKYANEIIDKYSPYDIIKLSGLKESFRTELNKGLNIYKGIISGKYGVELKIWR